LWGRSLVYPLLSRKKSLITQ